MVVVCYSCDVMWVTGFSAFTPVNILSEKMQEYRCKREGKLFWLKYDYSILNSWWLDLSTWFIFQLWIFFNNVNHSIADGSMCKRTWDGWMCWEDLDAGVTSAQHCPGYYTDFDASGESHVRLLFCRWVKFTYYI